MHLFKRIACITILVIASITLCRAQKLYNGTITGRITNEVTGLPINGVTISLPDLKIGASTDSYGKYILTQLPRGNYLIQVKAIGYAAITRSVNLSKTLSLDFQLTPSNYELADVIVTAPGNITTKQRTPMPITVVTHNMITQGVSNTAIDEIALQPGINETTEGVGTTKPQINGLGFDRVLTLMDGVPQVDFQWGDDHGVLIDPYAVYDAEIIRGPASLQYGASAEAGVISFKSEPFPENGTVLGSVLTEYHTNNGYLGTSLHIARNNNGFVWGLTAS